MSWPIVRSVPVADELVGEDGALVLLAIGGRARVIKVSPLGQLIRELTAGGVPLAELTAELVSQLGPPPGGNAEAAVRAAVAELQQEGLIMVETAPRR